MSDTYTTPPSHALRLTGIWDGYPTWDLDCLHPDTEYHTDDEGTTYDTCLIKEWHDNVGTSDIVGTSQALDDHGRVLLWVITLNHSPDEPQLVGWPEYEYWKDCQD